MQWFKPNWFKRSWLATITPRSLARYILLCCIILGCVATFYVQIKARQRPCYPPSIGRMIALPNGEQIPFHDESLQPVLLSSVLTECGYNNDGRFICPNVKHLGETVVRQMQLSYGRLLRIVDVMSRRYGFNYWISKGTLMGAARDGRFIPWDEDTDIGMLRKDFYILFKYAMTDLKDLGVFLQSKVTDLEYGKAVVGIEAKLRDKTTCYGYCRRMGCKHRDGYQIDIMIFDEISPGTYEDFHHSVKRQHSDIFPLGTISLEGFTFRTPLRAHFLLRQKYGDYMALPPVHQRCTPFVGIPWSSCEEVLAMNDTYREKLLRDTMMS